ncbi:MAG: hypothetical protein KatS3mg010_0445 [Acidimicrobiia bacterium]|nr:MAG: hypothetical protein KatS3mg010_0445 [Acidimicrobiia bacterium]
MKRGGESTTVTGPDVRGVPSAMKSKPTTRTEMTSPLSPRPVTDRSSVGAVCPAMATPFLRHW